jgi:ferritin heavy chain
MLLKSAPAFSVLLKTPTPFNGGADKNPLFSYSSSARSGLSFSAAARSGYGDDLVVSVGNNKPLAGEMFDPFKEVKKELDMVPTLPHVSLARQKYADECEAALNDQINVEYNVSYVYHSLFAYFDRDNVALKGFAKFFKESSLEEREHAEKLMEYQNKRGGRVHLKSIVMPLSDYVHVEKGDALYAMELALSLEKLTNEKLLNLHNVASENNDPHMVHLIESEFLSEQVESIKKISEYVAQLRRVGKGHGVWHFDQMLFD